MTDGSHFRFALLSNWSLFFFLFRNLTIFKLKTWLIKKIYF